jgi:hypothetical protein
MDTSTFKDDHRVNRLQARSYTDAILHDNQKIAFIVLKHIDIFRRIAIDKQHYPLAAIGVEEICLILSFNQSIVGVSWSLIQSKMRTLLIKTALSGPLEMAIAVIDVAITAKSSANATASSTKAL